MDFISFHFKRLPLSSDQRAKWVEAIEKHQKIDRQKFNVCIRHFQDEDLQQRGHRKALIPGAIPLIFPSNTAHSEYECIRDPAESADINFGMEVNESRQIESIIRAELENLKREVLVINTENSLKVQRLEQNINSSENDKKELSDNLKNCQFLLKKEKAINAKLNAEISLLKKDRFISWNDTKFSNVINANFFINPSFAR